MRKISIRTMYVELTSACNLRCRYCYNKSGEKADSLDYKPIINFLNNVKPFWSGEKREVFLSGGEPLLYDRYFDVIVETKKLGYFTYGAYIMRDEVYYRLCVLVEDQIIVMKC